MFETAEQLLSAYVKFSDSELDSPDVSTSLMVINIDGTQHTVFGAPLTIQRVSDVINAINNSAVGQYVTASVTYNSAKSTHQVTLTANDTSITSITVVNDNTLIFARGTVNRWDPLGNYANAVDSVETLPSEDGPIVDQIEPKNDGGVLEQVFLPIHTRITSDEPELNIDYWANYIHNTDQVEMTPVSVVSAKHPSTGVPVVYIMYISTIECLLTIECRYASGSNSGQLVTGMTNQVTIPATDFTDADTYYTTPKLYSGALAYDPIRNRLYAKVVVGGRFFMATEISKNCTLLEVMSIPMDLSMSTSIAWTQKWYLGEIPTTAGQGIYQRSDAGLVVDADGNIIVATAIAAFQSDPNGADGYPDVSPGFALYKMSTSGSVQWSKYVYSEWYESNVNGLITVVHDLNHDAGWAHYPFPAFVDVKPNGDIYVGHCSLLHKFDPNGNSLWAKNFPAITASYGVLIAGEGSFSPPVHAYISGVQVHPTENVIYVAASGALVTSAYDQPHVMSSVFKIADANIGDYTQLQGAFWFSPQLSARVSSPWNNDVVYLTDGLSIKLNAVDNTIFAVTTTPVYGDPYSGTPANGLIVAKIDATAMNVVWAYDNAIVDWFGGNTSPEIQLDGPIPSHSGTTFGGYTNIDIVTDADGIPTAMTTCIPMWYDMYAGIAPSRGGWVVTQSLNTPPISSVTTGDIQYTFADITALQSSWDNTVAGNVDLVTMAAHNGVSAIVPDTFYSADMIRNTDIQRSVIGANSFMENWLFVLPPMTAVSTPSLYVDNIARVGELQLGGVFPAPMSSMGTPADKRGMLRADANGLYYCTTDYNGTSQIWKTIQFAGGSGGVPVFRTTPPGFGNGTITGGPADKMGEIYIAPSGLMLMCVGPYTGADRIWEPIGVPSVTGGLFYTEQIVRTTSNAQPSYWPDGEYVSDYTNQLSVTVPMDVSGGCFGKPGANAIIMNFIVPRDMWISSSNAGYGLWRCIVAPTTSATLTIQRNGTTIGTVRFNAGSYTGSVVMDWGLVQLNQCDVFRVVAPASQDSTLSDISFTIVGGLNQ